MLWLQKHFYIIYRSSMANAVSTGSTSAEEKRWSAIGICLNKILAPSLRKAADIELQDWYNLLTRPPHVIDEQVFTKHRKTLLPSKFPLQYRNVNSNNVHNSRPKAWDYAVKDHLSLAKLFVRPSMTRCTGFDETMELSAVLSIICEACPFVRSGVADHAKNVRSSVRSVWADSDFSEWTNVKFNDATEEMQCLVEGTNLSDVVKKEVCDDLQRIKNKGICSNYFCTYYLEHKKKRFTIFKTRGAAKRFRYDKTGVRAF